MTDVIAAIVLAAGNSSRMEGDDKLWADLGGKPVVARSLESLIELAVLNILVIVSPSSRHKELRKLIRRPKTLELRFVEGGDRRQDSVAAGIAAAAEADWYLVHDGARQLATVELSAAVLDAARLYGAAIPGVPVTDTLKRVHDNRKIIETVNRTPLRAIQTPQAFSGDVLREAHKKIRGDVTDDAAMVEELGYPVALVEGETTNLKVTRKTDLLIARTFFEAKSNTQRGR